MDVKDIDKSKFYKRIIFSLFDGKQKSAYRIAKEWGSNDDDEFKDKCEYLTRKILIKDKKSNRYSLDFNSIIEQLDSSIQIYGKGYLLKRLRRKDVLNLVSFIRNDVKIKKGDYSLFIMHLNLYLSNSLMLDVANKIIENHPDIDKETKIVLRRMKVFLDNKRIK